MKVYYSEEEVKMATLNFFNSDALATNVWMTKYALKDGENYLERSPEDSINRYVEEFYRIENKYSNPLSKERIFELLKNYKYFIPAGSPMHGLGNNSELVSLSNCFVLGNTEDSYSGIMETDEHLVQIMKRRGGVGTDISHLRPKGSITRNAAKTSTGAVSFMERYSNTTREVAQEGRRGALMLTIDINHPDVMDFITVKDDLTKVTGANISVKVDNKFMEAVLKDEYHILTFPKRYFSKEELDINEIPEGKLITWANCKILKIKAQKIWELLVHQAWKSAEPGILFWDTILENSPADCYVKEGFRTVSTNPCQPVWAPVLTPMGISTIGKINIGDYIWSKSGWTKVINKMYTGNKKVYNYKTTFGSVYCTENHKLISKNSKVEARDATTIDLLRGKDPNILSPNGYMYIMDGLLIGDGSVHKASNNLIYLCIGKNDKDYFNSVIKYYIGRHRPALGESAYEVDSSLTSSDLPYTYERKIPEKYLHGDSYHMKLFLKGLYSANGSVVSRRVTLKGASEILIEQVQLMLNSLGIASYITTNKSKKVLFSNGEYTCKKSYDLNITRDRELFYNSIGFLQNYKNVKLVKSFTKQRTGEVISKKIIEVVPLDKQPVYDITVDNDSHTYWSGGFNISNCSELTLNKSGSCLLGSMNIFSYVNNPFKLGSTFNWQILYNHSFDSQRLMDNLVDLEIEKIERILIKISKNPEKSSGREYRLWIDILTVLKNGRRTGLGQTGLADTAAALNIRYGSPEFIQFADKIQETISKASYESSIEMASERGAFPIFNYDREHDHIFINRILSGTSKGTLDIYKKYGRRNIANLTIAPNGSLSILARVSSGIEPVFMLEYNRKRKVSNSTKDTIIDKMGDHWETYSILHPRYQQYLETIGSYENSPYDESTANEIDPFYKLKMQGIIQKWVDHSISVTYNLPKETTEKTISDIYIAAWKEGCKGVTVYREGSRDGVLVAKELKEKEEFLSKDAPVRPKILDGEATCTTVRGEKFTVIVGLLNNKPYEIFAYKGNGLSGTGKIVKVKRGSYKFVTENSEENITDDLTEEQEAITRGYSFGLRHGGHVKFAAEQLDKTKGDLSSFNKAIARVLRRFVASGEYASKLCPECKHRLVYESGCENCKNCGYSRCG